MSVVGNTLSEIGDQILVIPTQPLIGVVSFASYALNATGVTATRFFKEEFRYGTTGFLWSDWTDLTNGNIAAITVASNTTPFFFQYRLTRDGIDATGLLEFISIEPIGTYLTPECGQIFNQSTFTTLVASCHDPEILTWCTAVLEKLYEKGIVPEYITRGTERSEEMDADYISFWRTVACFFGLVVKYVRVFETLYDHEELLSQFLIQRNMYLCGTESLTQLQYLAENYFDQMRRRGTSMMDQDITSGTTTILGELKRLICYNPTCDEYQFELTPKQYIGWNIGNSSPLYQGNYRNPIFFKGYELTEEVVSASAYPFFGTLSPAVTTDDIPVLDFVNPGAGLIAGIGLDYTGATPFAVPDLAISVNSCFTYEITFLIKQTALSSTLTFGCLAFDENDNQIDLVNITDEADNNFFFEQISLNIAGQYYLVRGILHSRATELNATARESSLDIGYGVHKRMSEGICKILPIVASDFREVAAVAGNLYIKDFKVALSTAQSSRGFIQATPIIQAHFQNNNGEHSTADLQEIISNFFIPYNSTLLLTEAGDLCASEDANTDYWIDSMDDEWEESDTDFWFWW